MVGMKKAATIGAALLGLLFVGASWSQDPTREDAALERFARRIAAVRAGQEARQDPPGFRDVLRGKVGQECTVSQADGIWTVLFPAGAMSARQVRLMEAGRLPPMPVYASTLAAVGADFVQLREADGTERFVPLSKVEVVVRPGK